MDHVDVAIVGAGLAGSLAANMIANAGFSTVLIDPFHPFRPDFRCEKLEPAHVEAMEKTGIADQVLAAARRYGGIWIGRNGMLVEKRAITEYGIDYAALVNTVRGLLPGNVAFLHDKVTGIELTPDRQIVTLSGGSQFSARLVIAANGLNASLLDALGMRRREISRCHSISIGFDIAPLASSGFPFDALTYFGEHPASCVAYLTLFPLASHIRGNLFVYRGLGNPWLKRLRDDPAAAMSQCMPRLNAMIGDFRVDGPLKIRPVDLYATENTLQPGIILVGDAYATACPVSGTGASKALVDVERLCNVHVPAWMASAGMGTDKIRQFYADPVKLRSDADSLQRSLFAKRLTLESGPVGAANRWARFAASIGRNAFNQIGRVWSPAAKF